MTQTGWTLVCGHYRGCYFLQQPGDNEQTNNSKMYCYSEALGGGSYSLERGMFHSEVKPTVGIKSSMLLNNIKLNMINFITSSIHHDFFPVLFIDFSVFVTLRGKLLSLDNWCFVYWFYKESSHDPPLEWGLTTSIGISAIRGKRITQTFASWDYVNIFVKCYFMQDTYTHRDY